MTRRLSMATALLLTTIAGFVVTAYASNSGLFGGRTEIPAPAASPPAGIAVTPQIIPPTPTPKVIEQVIYRDEYLPAPAPEPGAAGQPVVIIENEAGQEHEEFEARPGQDEDDHEDDEGHDDD